VTAREGGGDPVYQQGGRGVTGTLTNRIREKRVKSDGMVDANDVKEWFGLWFGLCSVEVAPARWGKE
jgi:hypothetical protein